MSQASPLSALSVANYWFTTAQRHGTVAKRIDAVTLVVALTVNFLDGGPSYVAALVGLGLAGTGWHVRRRGKAAHQLGEAVKRQNLLADAFGQPVATLDLSHHQRAIPHEDYQRLAGLHKEEFYASWRPAGLRRLADNLQESAFWTGHLYERAAIREMQIAIPAASGLVLVCLALMYLTGNDHRTVVATVVSTLLSFAIAADYVGRWAGWRAASAGLAALDRQLEGTTPDEREAVAAFGEYSVVTSTTHPIPPGLYEVEKSRLNFLWSSRGGV